ncbi:MAG: magnesium transporter CorA family protein [Treponema sp.]|nr:magnesium transporter CorA family protein [Treponema sp.]
MISYWQQENGKLIKKEQDELDPAKNTWVDARSVTRDDINELEETYGIDSENMIDILDPDELSRIEKNEDTGYTLTIMKLPVFSPGDDVSYFTAPLGIIIKEKFLITICWTNCEVLKDFAANRIKEISLNDFPSFTIRFMARADVMFLRYLKELNRRATTIQNEMLRSVQNRELIQLLNIQKSLVYFTTSLKSNQMLLEKMRKTKILKLDEEDQDWLDDVEIDNRQAMEMADTYTNIMANMNDSFATVLSNNLNIVMKTMTAWNLVLMLPTLVTSFFGANVPLPWDGTAGWKWTGAFAIFGICMLTAIWGWFFFMKRKITSFEERSKRATLKQRRDSRKQKRFLKQQERKAAKVR